MLKSNWKEKEEAVEINKNEAYHSTGFSFGYRTNPN
jgi:hypothetical protein